MRFQAFSSRPDVLWQINGNVQEWIDAGEKDGLVVVDKTVHVTEPDTVGHVFIVVTVWMENLNPDHTP